jgi:ubiquitin-protein ligase
MGWRKYHKNLTAQRLFLEQQAMKQEHPSFRLQQSHDGSLSWAGSIKTVFGKVYKVRIRYTKNYPLNEPEVYVISPPVKERYMSYGEKGMCLCRQTESGKWSPDRATPVVTVRQAAEWLHRYDRQQVKGIPFEAPL